VYATLLGMGQRLLINWVYYHPIGHAMEAYRAAQAFRNSNPDMHIAVALNARTAIELASCVPAVDAVYPIAVDDVTSLADAHRAIVAVPRDWDYVYADPRQRAPMGSEALDLIAQAVRSSVRTGLINDGWDTPDGYPPHHLTPLALDLPEDATRFAQGFVSPEATARISLLLGAGSDANRTPPLAFWRALIGHLVAGFPGVEIVLLGALGGGRTVTSGLERSAIDALVRASPAVRDAFDLGLLNQLAIARCCCKIPREMRRCKACAGRYSTRDAPVFRARCADPAESPIDRAPIPTSCVRRRRVMRRFCRVGAGSAEQGRRLSGTGRTSRGNLQHGHRTEDVW